MRNPWYKVPALKKELGLTGAKYRKILGSFGLASSKDITDIDQTYAIMDAMRGLKPKKLPPKKVENLFAFTISKPHEPWKWSAVPEGANIGNLIAKYAEQHITVVGVLDQNGWRLKWRHMTKGRDY